MDSSDDESCAATPLSTEPDISLLFDTGGVVEEETGQALGAERQQQLGFQPQKELPYNRLLPYGDEIDAESLQQFAEIKAQLALATLFTDARPGVMHWTSRLLKYIRLHGFKFSKEDHVHLVKLYYQLLVTKVSDPSIRMGYANALASLLKKRALLSRKDLQLPWRPLYDLYESVAYSSKEDYGLVLVPENIDTSLQTTIKLCRTYFPVSSTQEMLDEWRPLLCAFDTSMFKAISYLDMFLPTLLYPHEHQQGFHLWFSELMHFWSNTFNVVQWEPRLVVLFARTAANNIGYIDWEPYIPMIFTRLLRSFELPVGSSVMLVGNKHKSFDIHAILSLVASLMGGSNMTVVAHIEKLFHAIDSFYHPSNSGRWNTRLGQLLRLLPDYVVRRLHRERYKKPTWEPQVPDSHKIGEEEITRFVLAMRPVVYVAMFSKFGSQDAATALHHLSSLRPQVVVPGLLDRLYPALETLTEPHRLTASLNCIASVARSLLDSTQGLPEGRSHALQLLMLTLPGLDVNDIRKCMVTFQFLTTFCTLIPMIDCSSAVETCGDELSEPERALCVLTSQLEDFVLQFVEKCLTLIETTVQSHGNTSHHEKMSQEELLLQVGIASTLTGILHQCSARIYDLALGKIERYVKSTVIDINVAGKLLADVCRSVSKVNAKKGLKALLPHLCERILALTEHEEVQKEEHVDDELLYALQLISELVRCDGRELLHYMDELRPVLTRSLHLTCKKGYQLSTRLLRNIFKSFVQTYPLEYQSVGVDYGQEISSSFLPIRHWAESGNLHQLNLQWHVPTQQERDEVQQLLCVFLLPELDKLERYRRKEESLSKEMLEQTLIIIGECMYGAAALLPHWLGTEVKCIESMVPLHSFSNTTNPPGLLEVTVRDGSNVRQLVVDAMSNLIKHLLEYSEDDTSSFEAIIKILSYAVFYQGILKEELDQRWKNFRFVKVALQNKLVGHKKHIRALLIDRVLLQHETRMLDRNAKYFTETHLTVMKDLVKLAVSHYSQVRSRAQYTLHTLFNTFAYCYTLILPDILRYLQDSKDISHEELKGALYIICTPDKKRSLTAKHDWSTVFQLWPAVINVQHSDKPSIVALLDMIGLKLNKRFDTLPIDVSMDDSCHEAGRALLDSDSAPIPAHPLPSDKDMEEANSKLEARIRENKHYYHATVNKLVDMINTKLHWRHEMFAHGCLSLMLRDDILLPAQAVRVFVKHLNHDSLLIRKICISSMGSIFKQLRLQVVKEKVEIDPYTLTGADRPAPGHKVQAGIRPDNGFLLYKRENQSFSEEEAKQRIYIHKTFRGYYAWPKQLQYEPPYDPYQALLRVGGNEEQLKVMADYLGDAEFVKKLVDFLSLEENKHRDKFDSSRYRMFKGLFRTFGCEYLPMFEDHIKEFVADVGHESKQRCASEIMAGLVRGCKHWTYPLVARVESLIIPLLRNVLKNVNAETSRDWGTCFATISENMDANKIYWLFEALFEQLFGTGQSSFMISNHLYMLQGILNQQEWRVPGLLQRLLSLLQEQLAHPYKNVRNRLGSIISTIFLYELNFPFHDPQLSTSRKDFIESLLPQLRALEDSVTPVQSESQSVDTSDTSSADAGSSRRIKQKLSKSQVESLMKNAIFSHISTADGTTADLTAGILSEILTPQELAGIITKFQVQSRVAKSPVKLKLSPASPDHHDGDEESEGYGMEEDEEEGTASSTKHMFEISVVSETVEGDEEGEKKAALRLCQTVLKWLISASTRTFHPAPAEVFHLLPTICRLNNELTEEELKQDLQVTLAGLASSYLSSDVMPTVVSVVEQISRSSNWHSRSSVLSYMQVMVFSNLFNLINSKHCQLLNDTVIYLLKDDRPEVRDMASTTLSGFLHCNYMSVTAELLAMFQNWAATRIRKKHVHKEVCDDAAMAVSKKVILRHAGVLGLGACIAAFPYDVPAFMPDVLMTLCEHVTDPQPIHGTVKKILSNFKRTHLDCWQEHKEQFTEDQLVVLTDLLVSPNYYA